MQKATSLLISFFSRNCTPVSKFKVQTIPICPCCMQTGTMLESVFSRKTPAALKEFSWS